MLLLTLGKSPTEKVLVFSAEMLFILQGTIKRILLELVKFGLILLLSLHVNGVKDSSLLRGRLQDNIYLAGFHAHFYPILLATAPKVKLLLGGPPKTGALLTVPVATCWNAAP